MGVSADLVQIAIVKEDKGSYGVTPDSPVWLLLPITSEGLVPDVTTTNSNLLGGGRETLDSILQGISAGGDISSELVITPALELLLKSAMCSDLTDINPAVVGLPANSAENVIGQQTISFTLEKRFPDPSDTASPPTKYLYHRIPGCIVNTMGLSASPGEPVNITFGILGKTMETGTTSITGASYPPLDAINVLRGPDVFNVSVGGKTVTTNCFGAISINLNNNFRGLQCLGVQGNKGMALGSAEVDGGATISFTDNALMDMLLAQTDTAVDVEIGDSKDPMSYLAAHLPRVKLTGDSVVAGGKGQDVVDEIAFTGLKNDSGTNVTLGTNNYDKTTLRMVVGTGTKTATP